MQANNTAGVFAVWSTDCQRAKRATELSIVVVNKLTKFPRNCVIERISLGSFCCSCCCCWG